MGRLIRAIVFDLLPGPMLALVFPHLRAFSSQGKNGSGFSSFSMPLISVNDQGDSLYYEDTGAPPTSNGIYTTLMVVHGTGFHGQIFRRLLPLAPQYQIRLVLINRRDYPGSSPYTQQELDKIRVDNAETHNSFAKARAEEFARFIQTFIEKEKVPTATPDWKRGGILLMAWSSGNSHTLPLLAYIDSMPKSTRDFIEPYLRSHVVYDAAIFFLGAPPGPDFMKDTSLTEEERAWRFAKWVSGYYTHRSLTSRNLADLQEILVEGSRPCTINNMTPQEIKETTCFPAIARSEFAFLTGSPSIFAERIRRALFDDELAKYWPRVIVDVVWCEQSVGPIIEATWEFQRRREKADKEGIKGRPLKISMMPGANHFPHWDEPERTMKFLADLINPVVITSRL